MLCHSLPHFNLNFNMNLKFKIQTRVVIFLRLDLKSGNDQRMNFSIFLQGTGIGEKH